jgi:ribosomal protein L16/L10AE
MSLQKDGQPRGRRMGMPVADQSFTVTEFAHAERMSKGMVYRAWNEGWGPAYYWVGVTRRITQAARLEWQRQREAAAREAAEQAEA